MAFRKPGDSWVPEVDQEVEPSEPIISLENLPSVSGDAFVQRRIAEGGPEGRLGFGSNEWAWQHLIFPLAFLPSAQSSLPLLRVSPTSSVRR
jgi:hypothetical protein